MRREPTEAEDRLWHELRGRRLDRIKFRRQVPVGKFIADFVCAEASLIVEIDGSQHADSNYDRERDAELKARGFRVLRFWNDDVLRDLNAVCTPSSLMSAMRICNRGGSTVLPFSPCGRRWIGAQRRDG
ncbi:endonuclease domain-containing protein [Mesorhizobium sp.]|uniref:endonuclease domain-containing protein n=1 Tax=Mesorhizobium sp. TaxID=1871066 RepID=UPI00338FDF30